MRRALSAYSQQIFAAMRVVFAFLYLCHGLQKWFGLIGGHAVPLGTLLGAAAVIETVLGALILIGLMTSIAAFVASGEMAVAYFMVHAPRAPWPVLNGGEIAVALCFGFLYIAAHGGGRFSVDELLRRRR